MKKITEKQIKVIFLITITVFALILTIIQPVDAGPDEKMKMDICKYIAKYNTLPHGGDEAVRDATWGISYGFTPILSYMAGSIFLKVTNICTQNIHIQYISVRLISVICYCIMAVFIIKIGEKLFKNIYYKWIFIMLTTIMPQVIFLASYINNDSLALMSISIIIYSWIIGKENNWNYKSLICLAIGIGLCALSYYNAYGYILTSIFLFIADFVAKKDIMNLLKKGLIISCIVLTICGWWFVRSYIIYNGDFLGLHITDEYAEKYAKEGFKPSDRETPDNKKLSLVNMLISEKWLKETIKSFIGTFGGMSIILPIYCYIIYFVIIGTGGLGYIASFYKLKRFKEMEKGRLLLEIIFVLNIIIPILLSLYYSYYSDFQPQGRYIMPILIPLMYFVTTGLKNAIEKLNINYNYITIMKLIIIASIAVVSVNTLTSIGFTYY